MTTSILYAGKQLPKTTTEKVISLINPCQTLQVATSQFKQGFLSTGFHANAPLQGNRNFEDDMWAASFAGDIIEHKEIPWKQIIHSLENQDYQSFVEFNGLFSITALNKETDQLFVVSDRRSQFPIYYLVEDSAVCASTELSVFAELPVPTPFGTNWLWEYLFFYFAINQITFYDNVMRMPAASVLKVDLNSHRMVFTEYAPRFRKKENLLHGDEAFKHAYEVFSKRVPLYFEGVASNQIAVALTKGWDTRTNLSLCPNPQSVLTYTYGIPGAGDLVEAAKAAKIMGLAHIEFFFDEEFENGVPKLIVDIVKVSSGLERINRGSLLYVYRNLTENGKEYPLVISGIGTDGYYRGHLGTAFVSRYLVQAFTNGVDSINWDPWKERMGASFDSFKNYLLSKLNGMETEYGCKLTDSEAHLLYDTYVADQKGFSGEIAVAKQFSTLRVPGWDSRIIDLAYSMEESTLTYSEFAKGHKRGSREEAKLQAYIITRSGSKLADLPINGVPPKYYAKNAMVYRLFRAKNLGPRKIRKILTRKPDVKLEDWDRWLNQMTKGLKTSDSQYTSSINVTWEENDPEHFASRIAVVQLIADLFFPEEKQRAKHGE